jgi:hypothetical protein
MDECKRHRWSAVSAFPIEKSGPTGHPSGRYGMWETRACRCGATDVRYAPGINARSKEDARRAYGVKQVDRGAP